MSDKRYFDLTIPAPRRLAMMRADFAAHPARYPHCSKHCKPLSWRNVRHWGHHNWEGAFCTLDDGNDQWYCHTGPYFRGERDAHEIRNTRHRGWYTDTGAQETAIGIVARLPHGRFLAGYRWTENDERVYFPGVFECEIEAARRADSHAESFAEDAREHSERFDAMQSAESFAEDERAHSERFDAMQSAEDDYDDACANLRAAWRQYKTARVAWAVDSARFWGQLELARKSVRDAIESLREARETLREATAVYEGA